MKKILLIKWVDSSRQTMEWYTPEEVGDLLDQSLHVVSIGFLLKNEKEAITITQSLSDDGCVIGILTIPKKSILSRKILCRIQ
jgi:hypothetical protein